ncbi:MAG: alpha/beta fold hydrolase [Pseudomonadota bacterium]
MAEFLLVHGSCHGAWCWRDLIPEIQATGHVARAIDLPSHGSDPTPIADVTLDTCRDAILAACTPDTILLGHSWGGYPISAAAEAQPGDMRALVYLCAYVPHGGQSLIEMRRSGPRQTIGDAIEKSADGLAYMFRPDKVQTLFYHDCPPETVPYALARLCPQPIGPQETGLHLGTGFTNTPKAYIKCMDDRIIPPEYQEQMSTCVPPDLRLSINSSHSPFFSKPKDLARILADLEAKL